MSGKRVEFLTGKLIGLSIPLLLGSAMLTQVSYAEIVFKEDFDDLRDFTSTMYSTDGAQQRRAGYTLPEGWDSLYNRTEWSPETGYPNNHASLEILDRNTDKARGGSGKSAVMWRESFSLGWTNWASDSQFIKFLDREYEELYIEFYIRFSENWYGLEHEGDWTSKIFRVGHFAGEGNEYSASKGDAGPMLYWNYKRDKFGMRNVMSFRGGPPGENYKFGGTYDTGISNNYARHIEGQEVGGADPNLRDQLSGTRLVEAEGTLSHEQVFGKPSNWTKVAFYVRMNSAPGVADGVIRQYVNGHRIFNRENVPWVMENSRNRMVGWNFFAIGGNDYFQPYDNSKRFEDWYAIDDIVVSTEPLIDSGASGNPPAPPSGLSISLE